MLFILSLLLAVVHCVLNKRNGEVGALRVLGWTLVIWILLKLLYVVAVWVVLILLVLIGVRYFTT